MKKPWLKLVLLLLAAVLILAGCAGNGSSGDSGSGGDSKPAIDKNKSTITIGMARPVSGVFSVYETSVFGPIHRMWVKEINDAGGIYVKEYDKKMPLEVTLYDDTSDLGTMIRMSEKLMLEDKVDFLFPTCSTAFLFAQAEVATNHGYMLISAEGGAAELSKVYDRYPMVFHTINHSTTQIPALVDIFTEQGIKSVFIVFLNDLHGIEYSAASAPAFAAADIEVKGLKSIPIEIEDLTPVLNEAMASGADAFLLYAYPQHNYPAIGQAMAIGYNPKVFLTGPGSSYDDVVNIYGDAVEGLMGFGAYNEKSSPGVKDFIAKYRAANPGVAVDWWGHLLYYATLQVWQQAVEGVGTLDNAAVAEYIKNNKFQTVMGEIWYENNAIAEECFLGNIGQWQNGVFEVIDVGSRRTADPIIPKPAW